MINVQDLKEGASYLIYNSVENWHWIAEVTKIEFIDNLVHTVYFKDILDIDSDIFEDNYSYNEKQINGIHMIVEKEVTAITNPEYFL